MKVGSLVLYSGFLLFCVFTSPNLASSQTMQLPRPSGAAATGPGGVNIVTGILSLRELDLSAGPADDDAKVSFSRFSKSGLIAGNSRDANLGQFGWHGYFTHNFNILIPDLYRYSNPGMIGNVSVSVNDKVYHLAGTAGGILTSIIGDGSKFRTIGNIGGNWNYELITADGTRYVFERSPSYNADEVGSIMVKYVEFPSGDFYLLKYDQVKLPREKYVNVYPTVPDFAGRLASVENSRGYGLRLSYVDPVLDNIRSPAKRVISAVTSYKKTCASRSVCSSTDISSVSYSYIIKNVNSVAIYFLSEVRKADGDRTRYSDNSDNKVSIFHGDSSKAAITYTLAQYTTQFGDEPDANAGIRVVSVTDDKDNTVTYGYEFGGNGTSTVVDLPGGKRYNFQSKYHPLVERPEWPAVINYSKDPLGNETRYIYDNLGRLTSVTFPEGNVIEQSLDSRGNVLEVTQRPKTGSTLPAITEYRQYPLCDSLDVAKTCNKVWKIKGPRNEISYRFYSRTSGIETLRISPSDGSGLRAAVKTELKSFSPMSINGLPSGSESVLVYRKLSETRCTVDPITGDETKFAFACPVGNTVVTQYLYKESTANSPSDQLLTAESTTWNKSSRTTCYAYDSAGNKVSEIRPKGTC